MAMKKKIGNRLLILGIVLLLSVNVFAQEASAYVEKYLNSISFFNRLFLNIVIEKIDPTGNSYIRLDKDVLVKLIITSNIDCYIDYTDYGNATIYITSGCLLILENEAEIVAGIAHELGHASSRYDRIYIPYTDEEYLDSEMAADLIGILVAVEMGYKPDVATKVFERVLAMYPTNANYQKFLVPRILVMKELIQGIYEAESENKYKEYLYFTETEFKAIKTIVKSLQDKKSGH